MPSSPAVVIVAPPADALALRVHEALAHGGATVRVYQPKHLAMVDVVIEDGSFSADDVDVAAVLWRVSPDMNLAEGFCAADRTFAAAETAAAWIAALNLPGVAAINRFDAHAWYSGLRSHYWRDRLAGAGIALTPMSIGTEDLRSDWQWSPYTTGDSCEIPEPPARRLMACACHPPLALRSVVAIGGEVTPPSPTNVERAALLLHTWGVACAAIDADADGRIHRVRVLPAFDEGPVLQHTATRLAGYLYEHCAAR